MAEKIPLCRKPIVVLKSTALTWHCCQLRLVRVTAVLAASNALAADVQIVARRGSSRRVVCGSQQPREKTAATERSLKENNIINILCVW